MCCEGDCRPDSECYCLRDTPLRGLLHLAMLASLKDKDAYGSDIHQSLKDKYGIDSIKPVIYTMLRRMEKEELVVSKWDVKSSGPAKRVYRITEEGLEYLKESTEGLRKVVTVINMLLGKEGKPDG